MNQYILLIETATPTCSVALTKGHLLLDTIQAKEPNMHATVLTCIIDELLNKHAVPMSLLSAVAVSMGPGSYTGLRIGVSVAKGLCYALDIPLISVSTLDAMTDGIVNDGTVMGNSTMLYPMIDARRMEVYTASYNHQAVRLSEISARIIDEHSFDEDIALGSSIVLFGSGADKFVDFFSANSSIKIIEGFYNKAGYLASKALEKYQAQLFEDVAYFEPFYLKEFVTTTPKKKTL